jgi:hypothetical protein
MLAADTDLSVEYMREVLERSDTPGDLRVAGLKLSVRPAA